MMQRVSLSPDAIRALDDADLTELAYTLGLTWSSVEPAARVPCMGTDQGWCTWDPASEMYHRWDPVTHVAQATALFRTLRTLGWHTHLAASPTGSGKVFVWRDLPDRGPRYGQAFGLEGEPAEARALVLCAVLAAAHTAGGQEETGQAPREGRTAG